MNRVVMSSDVEKLLDATDTTRRLLQHGAILAGITLLLAAGVIVNLRASLTIAIAAIVLGLVFFLAAAGIKQRWEVSHKGHRIRFENNPFRGEKLFIDDELVGRGEFGYRSRTRGKITTGDGAGDHILATSEAGLVSFRCRIVVEPTEPAVIVADHVSDQQLLDEVRRRGLHVKNIE